MMRSSSATRSSRDVCWNVSNAARAAFTAASTSSAVPSRILPTACSVAGLMTSSSQRPAGLTHAPLMKNFLKSYMKSPPRGEENDTAMTDSFRVENGQGPVDDAVKRRDFCRLAAHVGPAFRQQQFDVRLADQVEIPVNRVLQHRRGGGEVDRLLRVETADEPVQHAGRECVARADAIHDAVERVGAGRVGVPPAAQRAGNLL